MKKQKSLIEETQEALAPAFNNKQCDEDLPEWQAVSSQCILILLTTTS